MRILFATDGTLATQIALATLKQLSVVHASEVLVVAVVPGALIPPMLEALPDCPTLMTHQFLQSLDQSARAQAAAASTRLTSLGGRVSARILIGDPAREIVRAANEWQADLIVLGLRQRQSILPWLRSKIVRTVLQQASCPVLTAPMLPEVESAPRFRANDAVEAQLDRSLVATGKVSG